ncbi:importin-5 isoform X2 [Dendrobium catenatum]|uniref:importin-5 isoform X2 n=1 Tax=Dendrobium catenatum TaxID=906689 RepID=UPI0009F65B30|nr:importin-5 isoform X2 [Dendrobium catenatum]
MDPEQQMAAVLGSRPGAFATLISYLMSSDNKKRKKAESLFSLCRVHNPDVVALRLTHLLDSSLPQLRTMAAVLLRSHLISHGGGCDAGLSRLNAITKASIKSLLLAAVQREESKFLTKQLCDVVAEVAAALLPENEWPEFLPFMFQAVTSGSPHLQESSLLVFSRLSQCTRDPLLPHLASLHSVFLNSLSHPISSPDVRIAALGASINLVRCLPSAVDRDEFADLLPAMMLTLTEFLNSGNEAAAQEALKLLIELAGAEPKFLRRQLPHLVGSMLLIAEADALDESTRHLAIEFMITLAEARDGAPGMMRKLPQFIGRLFAVLMKMLLDIDDESTWHAAEEDDEDAWETDNYNFGQECLDRLSIAIGGTTIVPVAFELFPVYLASPDWQKHHAALITLALIAEGCSKVLIKNLEQVVTMALNSFQHPHPRVRWAAINAIRQLSTDLSPDLQVQYHQRVLPTLASAMDDFQNPRVQAHAASVILNFTENCAPGILTHYLDGFVSKLLVLLQNKKPIVQGAALIALASLADSSREQFQNYYDAVMPCLKTILLNATVKSNRMLLAKSMECISLVGMVVGKDKFRDDAKQVMEVLMSLQGSQIEIDDPIASYMLQAWTRLCQCLGQDFLPYMNFVMPPLLQSAQLEPDVTITSADSEYMDNSNEDRVEIANFGDKRIRIRTRVLEEKATACSMLCCYADELKENFYPWIDQVAPTLVPLLKFYFDEEVRRAAVSAMPELLRSAKLAVEKGLAQGRDESYVKQLFDYIVPALVEALHKEPEIEICSSMLDSLNQCMQLSGHLLDKGQIRSIVDEIKHLITASTIRKRERAERMKAEDFDAEEGEFLKEENEQEEEVFDQVSDCLGTMIKTFKTYFVPFLDELSVYLKPMWGRDKTPKERRIAICIFDDVAEQCQESALKYYDTYLPFLIEACNDGDAGVRRAAVYGIGVCAEFGGLVFRPFVGG